MNAKAEFLKLLEDAAEETGVELQASREEVAVYMDERATHLSTISHEPGFGRAVQREAVSIAMKAGIEISENATAVESKWFGIIAGAIRIAALALI